MNFDLVIQRFFNEQGYCKYDDVVENYLKSENCIDIPLRLINNKQGFNVHGKICHTGNRFFKVLIDGTVTRCFTKQYAGYNILGLLSKRSDVRILNDKTPCLSAGKTCQCYFAFINSRQIELNRRVNGIALFKYRTLSLFHKLISFIYKEKSKYTRILFFRFYNKQNNDSTPKTIF